MVEIGGAFSIEKLLLASLAHLLPSAIGPGVSRSHIQDAGRLALYILNIFSLRLPAGIMKERG